jgi:flagellar hook-associated protein 2
VVNDIAGAFTELASLGRELTRGGSATGSAGALVSDSATRRAVAGLSQLVTRPLLPESGSAPTRLQDIGLSLTRDGNFTVDAAKLQRAVNDHPDRIEAMVAALNQEAGFGQAAGPLRQLSETFKLAAEGSAAAPTALSRESADIARQRTLLDERTERSRDLMTRQYAALDRAVGESRALQSFLTQQIDLWTRASDF